MPQHAEACYPLIAGYISKAVHDSGQEARDGEFLMRLPPNLVLAVILELREYGFISSENTSPRAHGPMVMLKSPCKMVGHVGFIKRRGFSRAT